MLENKTTLIDHFKNDNKKTEEQEQILNEFNKPHNALNMDLLELKFIEVKDNSYSYKNQAKG
jgi:hypothetical protein